MFCQVVWTDHTGFVLTQDQKRIYEDQRFSVERPNKKYWDLHIRDVRPTDAGKYVCQINTNPVKTKEVMLYVQGACSGYHSRNYSGIVVTWQNVFWLDTFDRVHKAVITVTERRKIFVEFIDQ